MVIGPTCITALKFGDGDGPNLCRVKKVDFWSGLTLVSSNDNYHPIR